MNNRSDRFENPWTEKENENLKPFIGTPVSIAAADPAVRKIVKARGMGAVRQRLYKLRDQEATNGNGHGKPRKARKVARRKPKAPAPTPVTGTPLNYCPNCGCGLLAVRPALTL